MRSGSEKFPNSEPEEFRMKTRIVILLMVFLASTVFASAAEGFGHGMGKGGFRFGRILAMGMEIMDKLALTEEQESSIQGVVLDASVEIIPVGAELLVSKIKLMAEMKKDDPDMNVISPLIDSSAENMKKISKKVIASLISVKKILTPDQKKKLKALMKDFRKNRFKQRHGKFSRRDGQSKMAGHPQGCQCSQPRRGESRNIGRPEMMHRPMMHQFRPDIKSKELGARHWNPKKPESEAKPAVPAVTPETLPTTTPVE